MVKWINAFTTKVEISKTMSPSMILKGKPNPGFKQESILFGSYALFYTGQAMTWTEEVYHP